MDDPAATLSRLLTRAADALSLHPAWTLVLACEPVARALSYGIRPPSRPSPTNDVIEQQLGYGQWVVVLCILIALTVAGMRIRMWPIALVGHALGVFVYLTLAASITYAAVRFHQPWSAAPPLAVLAVMHGGRMRRVSSDLQHRQSEASCGRG